MSIRSVVKRFIKLFQKPVVIHATYRDPAQLLHGKRALVIGGSSGIGEAISYTLANAGCDVIAASRSRHTLKKEVTFIEWDISDIDNLASKFKEIIMEYGDIDIVVNSHGICPKKDFQGKCLDIDPADFDEVINVNLKSVYFCCQTVCHYFLENNKKGHILNIASTEGLKGAYVPYGISKAGVVSLTKGMGKKFASKGIVINGIAPGATATNMMDMIASENVRLDYIPSCRASLPKEIANLALFLISDMGQNMCGTVIAYDGGESLH